MHSFLKKFFKVVGFNLICVLTILFVGSAKSYALLDADKIVDLLSLAIKSDGDVYMDMIDLEIVRTSLSPSLSGSPLITESPGLETGLSKSGYVSLNDSEKQFLEPICSAYRLFFPDHKLNPTLKKTHCFKARSIPRILSVRYCCVCLKRLLQRLLRN